MEWLCRRIQSGWQEVRLLLGFEPDPLCRGAAHDEADGALAFFLQVRDQAGGAGEQRDAFQGREREAGVEHNHRDRAVDVDGERTSDGIGENRLDCAQHGHGIAFDTRFLGDRQHHALFLQTAGANSARVFAAVTGVDASEANIKTALTHAQEEGLSIDYRAGTAEGLIDAGEPPFDIVLNLEVVEHVADPAQFLKDTASLVRPGGLMIVATLNKTAKALATAVVGAEYVLGWLPRGTHDWSKFLPPEEVHNALAAAGLEPEPPSGVSYTPLTGAWKISNDTSVNYMIVAPRP